MKAGVIGTVSGDFDAVSSYSTSREQDGFELTDTLEITGVFSLPNGDMGFSGHAVTEVLRTQQSVTTDYGSIETDSEPRVEQRYTEIVGKPGEFVVASSSGGTFAFDMIAADTNTQIERCRIDVDGFYDGIDPDRVWKAGFAKDDGGAESGVLHGEDIRDDDAVTGVLERASLNQLGIEYADNGHEMNLTTTESGYLEVYQPREFDDVDFLQYVSDAFQPYLAAP